MAELGSIDRMREVTSSLMSFALKFIPKTKVALVEGLVKEAYRLGVEDGAILSSRTKTDRIQPGNGWVWSEKANKWEWEKKP